MGTTDFNNTSYLNKNSWSFIGSLNDSDISHQLLLSFRKNASLGLLHKKVKMLRREH